MNCSVKPRTSTGTRGLRFACGFAALAALATTTLAAPPKITRLSVRGFQAGAATRVNVSGTGLEGDAKLLLTQPIKSQQIVTRRPDGVVFEVVLDAAIVPGIEHLRIQTTGGVTAPELVTIDGLPQLPISNNPATPSPAPQKLPVALHGLVTGAVVQESTFAGNKGQAITIDVLAKRFGSKLRPVVHLYDPEKRQLAWSLPQSGLAGDARLTAVLPIDGTYTVAVHDLTYAAAAPSYYRLAIGTFDYADAVYPPVVARGASTSLELIGRFGDRANLPLAATAAASALSAPRTDDVRPLPWPTKVPAVGLRPFVQLSDLAELTEEQTEATARKLPTVPVAVSGRLLAPNETDLYQLDLAAKEKIRVELFADRLGSPLDVVLELRDAKGARLALNDDTVGPDPRLDFAAPDKPTPVTIAVSDALRRGDPTCVYRLVVTKVNDAAPTADFRLTMTEETQHVASDGTKVFRVSAERAGYEGPIRLTIGGLPTGFLAAPVEIPAAADGALVEVRRTDKAAPDALGRLTIRGEGVGVKPPLVRTAEAATHPLGRLQPWLKEDLVIASTDTKAEFAVAWDEASAKNATLYVGTDDKLSVQVLRNPAADGPANNGTVRLSLVTSQLPPPADQQAAAAQALQLRGVAATVDVKPAAPAKAKDPKATAAMKPLEPAAFAIRVPQELRLAEYDVALKAELLSADGKSTIAEAYTPPRRVRAQPPIKLTAEGAATMPIVLDAKTGAALTLAGSIERFQNFPGDVTVTLVGLPAGITAPSVVLKPKGDKFKLEFKLPPNFAAARLEGVKISASLAPVARATAPPVKVDVDVPPRDVTKSAPPAAAKSTAPSPPPSAEKPAKKPTPSAKPAK